MGFIAGQIMDTTDAGKLEGLQKEIACECWFTSTGVTILRFIKAMNETSEIFTIPVVQILSSDVKRFSGFETVEHICKVEINNRTEIVKLIFDKISCKWKMLFP